MEHLLIVPKSVQHFHCMDISCSIAILPAFWISFIDSLPNLKSMNGPLLCQTVPPAASDATQMAFLNRPNSMNWPSVEELVIEHEYQRRYLESLPPGQFPKPRKVYLIHRGIAHHLTFLSARGRNAKVVHFTMVYPSTLSEPTSTVTVDYLHQLADHCPRLEGSHWTMSIHCVEGM